MLDFETFAALLSESHRRFWLVAAAITGDGTEADDIVQEAALVALRKLEEFKPGTSFIAWMSQIVRLTALNQLQKSQRRGTLLTDPATLDRAPTAPSSNGDSVAVTLGREGDFDQQLGAFDDDVLRALNGIGDVARACLLLRVVQQLSYAEIAEQMQIPEGTAMSHVHRARQYMRERLAPRYARQIATIEDRQEADERKLP